MQCSNYKLTKSLFQFITNIFFTGWPATLPKKRTSKPPKIAKKHQKTPTKNPWFWWFLTCGLKIFSLLEEWPAIELPVRSGNSREALKILKQIDRKKGHYESLQRKKTNPHFKLLPIHFFPKWMGSPFFFVKKSISITYTLKYHWILNIYFTIPVLNRRNR